MSTTTTSPQVLLTTDYGTVTLTVHDSTRVRATGTFTVNRIVVEADLHLQREGSTDRYYGSPEDGWVVANAFYRRGEEGMTWPDSEKVSWNAQDKVKSAIITAINQGLTSATQVAAERARINREIDAAYRDMDKIREAMAAQEKNLSDLLTALANLPE